MNKETAIKKAKEEPGFKLENFDIIDEEEDYVLFDMGIRFIPRDSSYMYNLTVRDENTDSEILSNPYDREPSDAEFFQWDEESKKKVEFVKKVIEKEFPGKELRERINIYEDKEKYRVEVISEGVNSWYSIDKKSGEVSDEGHGHFS